MRPEPNFPVRPDEFVGRRQQIEAFREALQQGLAAGRTSSFAILGDWGIGKSAAEIRRRMRRTRVCDPPDSFLSFDRHSRLHAPRREPARQIRGCLAGYAKPGGPFAPRTSKLEIEATQLRRGRLGAPVISSIPKHRKLSPQIHAQGSLGSFLPARTIKRRDL